MSITEYVVQYGFSISLLANAVLFIPQIITLIKKKSDLGVSLALMSSNFLLCYMDYWKRIICLLEDIS